MRLGERIQTGDWKAEKHVPVIESPDSVAPDKLFAVKVSVGREIPHPNTTEHHIQWIDVYFQPEGDKFLYQVCPCFTFQYNIVCHTFPIFPNTFLC